MNIELLFEGDGSMLNSYRAWLIVGDYGSDKTGQHQYLTCSCADAGDLENQAERLKKQIDAAVSQAKRKFSKQNQPE